MELKPKLFSYVIITDKKHKHYGKKGQITDYDTIDKEYIVHFDKLTNDGKVYWSGEATRVKLEQINRISMSELEKIS